MAAVFQPLAPAVVAKQVKAETDDGGSGGGGRKRRGGGRRRRWGDNT